MQKINILKNKKKSEIVDIYFDLFLTLQGEISEEITLKSKNLLSRLMPDKEVWKVELDNSPIVKRIYYKCAVPILEKFCMDCIKKGLADNFNIRDIEEKRSGGIDLELKGIEVLSVDINFNKIYFMYSFKSYLFYINKITHKLFLIITRLTFKKYLLYQ